MALDSIWQPQINSWLSGQPMPVDDFGKPLPPTLAGLVPPPAPTQQAVLGGRPYDPTKLSPPPQQGPAPSPLAAALTSAPAGNAAPRPVVSGGPNNDALAQALLGNANSKAPILSPLDLLGRLAQVYSGNKLESEAISNAEKKKADDVAAKDAADAARRQKLIEIYNQGGGSPDALIQAGLAGGNDALVSAGLSAKAKAAAPLINSSGDLVQIVGADGKPQYVSAADAVGKSPYKAPTNFTPLVDPAARAAAGIVPTDKSPYQQGPDGHVYPIGNSGGLGGLPSQDDVTDIVDGIMSGITPPTSIAKNSKYNAPVIAALAHRGVDLSALQTDWTATQRHYASLNGAQQTRLRQNIDTVDHSLGVIDDLNEQWKAGGFPILNAANRQAALQGVLGADANRIATLLQAQISDVTGEMGSVLMGGNSPTDHAMELASQNLSADWSYETLKAALTQFRQNIQFRRNAIENVSAVTSSNTGLPAVPGTAPAGNAPAVAPPAATEAPYKEGDTATGPNGQTAVFHNGQWEIQ